MPDHGGRDILDQCALLFLGAPFDGIDIDFRHVSLLLALRFARPALRAATALSARPSPAPAWRGAVPASAERRRRSWRDHPARLSAIAQPGDVRNPAPVAARTCGRPRRGAGPPDLPFHRPRELRKRRAAQTDRAAP